MGKHIRYSGVSFTNEKCGWRFSDCSESSIEDILDSLNDAIEEVLRSATPRVCIFDFSIFFSSILTHAFCDTLIVHDLAGSDSNFYKIGLNTRELEQKQYAWAIRRGSRAKILWGLKFVAEAFGFSMVRKVALNY